MSKEIIHSKALIDAAEELGIPVDHLTAIDLLNSYPWKVLPDPQNCPEDLHLKSRSASETERLAAIGRKAIEDSRKDRGLPI